MSSDPFDVMFNYDDAAYNALDEEAKKDDRVGDHTFLVTDVVRDQWPSGEPRLKVKGNLTTANNAKADWTFSPPPPPEVIAAEHKSWDKSKQRAVSNAVTMTKQLAQHYSLSPGKIAVGQELKVKTAKNREGFVRIISFLSKDHAVGTQTATPPTTSVGF